VAEGDTIHRTARALQEALGGRPITGVAVPNPRSPLRRQGRRVDELRGSTMESAEARGKHLLLHFDRGLALHSHLGMRGSWRISGGGSTSDPRAWVVLSVAGTDAAELGGSHLDLRTDAELRSNPQLRSLGPDILAHDFDAPAGVKALRAADQSRQIGELLLDQRVLAGIGNIYKCEGCWSARIDPWRRVAEVDDDDLRRLVIEVGGLMRYGVQTGRTPRSIYRRTGQPCPRCGTRISSRGQGDANRTTYWCGSCQGADKLGRGIIDA
jgi:endonuclease-8